MTPRSWPLALAVLAILPTVFAASTDGTDKQSPPQPTLAPGPLLSPGNLDFSSPLYLFNRGSSLHVHATVFRNPRLRALNRYVGFALFFSVTFESDYGLRTTDYSDYTNQELPKFRESRRSSPQGLPSC